VNAPAPASTPPLESIALPGPRPLAPRISTFTAPFWERLAAGEFVVARCASCKRLTFPPQQQCRGCGAADLRWQPVSGRARVYSATVVHAAPAMFAPAAPYALVVLDLEEGVRLVTRWIGAAPACDQSARLVVLRFDDGVLFGATAA